MDILEKCADSFKAGRHHLILAIALLYEIREKELWKENYDTFTQYVEEECKIDKGNASKYLAVYEHFCIKGSVVHEQLERVDLQKLYPAMNLKGTPKEQFKKALLLDRGEIKQQRVYEKNGKDCEHPNKITICADCHARLP